MERKRKRGREKEEGKKEKEKERESERKKKVVEFHLLYCTKKRAGPSLPSFFPLMLILMKQYIYSVFFPPFFRFLTHSERLVLSLQMRFQQVYVPLSEILGGMIRPCCSKFGGPPEPSACPICMHTLP